MDKINIVSPQAVLEMSSFSMDTRLMSSSPLVNSLVKNSLFKTAPDIDQPPFQFIHTMDLSVVDTMLHDSPDLVIHRIEILAVWRPRVGRKKVWPFLDAAVQQVTVATCIADLFNSFVKKCMRLYFQGSAATNYEQSRKFNYTFVGR